MPPFVRLMAFIGILLGSTSVMFAVSLGRYFLSDRDTFLAPVRQQLAAMPSPSPSPSPGPMAELENPMRLAETLYDRRGVVLPLAGICLILSSLLVAGCVRALRGSAWGASAWKTACGVWLPFQGMMTVILFVGGGPPAFTLASILICGYCAASVLYLRRPDVSGLFR